MSLPDVRLKALISRANQQDPTGILQHRDVELVRRDLQSLIGAALSEARKLVKGTQAYAQWRKLNGLGVIPARACTEMRGLYEIDPFAHNTISVSTEILEELVLRMNQLESA